MRVLLIGATGVIGRRVVPSLVAAGHAVTAVARDAAWSRLSAEGATPIALDIFDRAAVARSAYGDVIAATRRLPVCVAGAPRLASYVTP